jgi:hypothetical protein
MIWLCFTLWFGGVLLYGLAVFYFMVWHFGKIQNKRTQNKRKGVLRHEKTTLKFEGLTSDDMWCIIVLIA